MCGLRDVLESKLWQGPSHFGQAAHHKTDAAKCQADFGLLIDAIIACDFKLMSAILLLSDIDINQKKSKLIKLICMNFM